MKVKTSVSLSDTVLSEVRRFSSEGERSEFIEKALWVYMEQIRRISRDAADLKKINEISTFLNKEANDSLSYQVEI